VVKRWMARTLFRVRGWTVEGERPTESKYVLIAAPHTSNWDLLYLLALSFHYEVPVSWLGKHTLFKGWMGPVMRRLGGVPVRRDQRSGMVDSLAAEFAAADSLVVVIPPEGTRSATDHWRSGFYRVAVAAGVPIVCGFVDYGRRVGGFGPVVPPSGDIEADIEIFRSRRHGLQVTAQRLAVLRGGVRPAAQHRRRHRQGRAGRDRRRLPPGGVRRAGGLHRQGPHPAHPAGRVAGPLRGPGRATTTTTSSAGPAAAWSTSTARWATRPA
jgi:hypothetical protein